jgi:L-arabinose isomerase
VFTARTGPAVMASIVEMGDRFRLVANKVNAISPEQPLPKKHLEDFAEMAGLEFLLIDEDTTVRNFKKELWWNDASWYLMKPT